MPNAAAFLSPLFDRAANDLAAAARSIARAVFARLVGDGETLDLTTAERLFAAAAGKARALAAMLGALDVAMKVDAVDNRQTIIQRFIEVEHPVWLDVPFEEAIEAYARARPVLAPLVPRLKELYAGARMFWIGQAASVQITERVKEALGRGLTEGLSTARIRDAIRAAEPAVRDWTDSYLELVQRNSLASAYERGRELQADTLGDFFMAWEWSAVGDADTRVNHMAADGVIVPKQRDDILTRFITPRFHRCRCLRRMITRPEAEDRGIDRALERGKILWADGGEHETLPAGAEPTAAELAFTGAGR